MKVIFLDVDGVLNSFRTAMAHNGFPMKFDDADVERFDHTAIALIKKIVFETGAKIVLSSSWRLLHKLDEFKAIGLDIEYATPLSSPNGFERGHEIQDWLNEHPEVEKYIIIDDDDDMLEHQQEFFIHTSMDNGFLLKHFDKAIEILGTTEEAK